MTKIPFLDLVTPHEELKEELSCVFTTALRTAEFVGGGSRHLALTLSAARSRGRHGVLHQRMTATRTELCPGWRVRSTI